MDTFRSAMFGAVLAAAVLHAATAKPVDPRMADLAAPVGFFDHSCLCRHAAAAARATTAPRRRSHRSCAPLWLCIGTVLTPI